LETDSFLCTSAISILIAVPANIFVVVGVSLLLLVVAALIAGAEVAVLSLNASTLEKLETLEDKKSLIIKGYLKEPDRLHLSVSIVTTLIIVATFFMYLPFLKNFTFLENCEWILFLLFIIAYSLILLIFTELIPRLFSRIAEQYIQIFAFPVKGVEILVKPISYFIEKLGGNQSRRVVPKHHISIEDISSALELTTSASNDEEDILKGLVNFGNIDVQKILKPRIDVVAVDKNTEADVLFELVIESGYSRIPVFSETFDNIVGILYVKDLLPFIKDLESFNWNSVIRPPYFVPETKKVKELLNELQVQKIHMAIVVDEYGGTTGIVTLEDILEEIVGEIADESDEDEQTFIQIDQNTYLFDGITLLDDFYRITQSPDTLFDDVRGDADTLAGLILELKGDIPENGDEVEFTPFLFIVEQVENRRIKQIKVIINKIEEAEGEKS
jgi:gliding motility-associated protein GldE